MDNDRQQRLMDLIKRHDRTIWRLCMRHVWGDVDLAGDMEQEVLLRIWEKMDSLTAAPCSKEEKAWVVKVTASVLHNQSRHSRHTAEELDDNIPDTGDDEMARQRGLLEEMAAYLPRQEREMLSLRLDGYSGREMAEILSISRNAVNIRFSRMLARMRKIYDKLYNSR